MITLKDVLVTLNRIVADSTVPVTEDTPVTILGPGFIAQISEVNVSEITSDTTGVETHVICFVPDMLDVQYAYDTEDMEVVDKTVNRITQNNTDFN